jgi:hypothetical protein
MSTLIERIERRETIEPQEIFDFVAKGLLAQGRQSLKTFTISDNEDDCGNPLPDTTTSACAYRGDDGVACAVGLLIPDDLYSPDWDGTTDGVGVHTVVFDRPSLASLEPHQGLLGSLQACHDQVDAADFARDLRLRMRGAAKLYHLDTSALDA